MRYDWSKLDAGWSVDGEKLQLAAAHGFKAWACWEIPQLEKLTGGPIGKSTQAALDQLAKCRIRDTERAPTYELPVNPRIEELRQVAPDFVASVERMGRELAQQTADAIAFCAAQPEPTPEELTRFRELVNKPAQCTICGMIGLHACEDPTPSQPWRRGPLAAWTLVNISCHDGRLTVVMKRGRGELIDETGVDDESLWERLGAKADGYKRSPAP